MIVDSVALRFPQKAASGQVAATWEVYIPSSPTLDQLEYTQLRTLVRSLTQKHGNVAIPLPYTKGHVDMVEKGILMVSCLMIIKLRIIHPHLHPR